MCTCKQQCQCEKKKTPHVHAEVIKAWADGAEIEWSFPHACSWFPVGTPSWDRDLMYRIKPELKPDVIAYMNVYSITTGSFYTTLKAMRSGAAGGVKGEIKLTFDGETGKLKSVEMVR